MCVCSQECVCVVCLCVRVQLDMYECGSHRTTLDVHQEFCLSLLSACKSAGTMLTLCVQLFTRVLGIQTHVLMLHSKCFPHSAMFLSTYRGYLVNLHTHMPVCCVGGILGCHRWMPLYIRYGSLPSQMWA